MIRQNDNAKSVSHKPWRRRISNQMAAFAAIMLFASTQVGVSESSLKFDSAKSQVASQNVLGEIGNPQLDLNANLNQAASDSAHKNSASKKKKTFKLNLFRLRH